jgi:hypothetical protein
MPVFTCCYKSAVVDENSAHSMYSHGWCTQVCLLDVQYVYLSMQEMRSLADLIKAEGRISVTRLAQEATRLLQIVPCGQDSASRLGDESKLDEILA